MFNIVWITWVIFAHSFFTSAYCQLQCRRNCSILSPDVQNRDVLHTITYSIQSRRCQNIDTSKGSPVKPDIFHDDIGWRGWYLYEDPGDNRFQRIALNFSWSPSDDASIEVLQGYNIKVRNLNTPPYARPIFQNIFFCFHHALNFNNNSQALFYFDRFGYKDRLFFAPEQQIGVNIRGMPEPSDLVKDQLSDFEISIPSCNDPALAKVYECQQLRDFTAVLSEPSCENRSVVVSYNIPSYFGKHASITLGQNNNNGLIATQLGVWENLSLSGNFTVVLPEASSLKNNFSISVWGNTKNLLRRYINFTLKNCTKEEIPPKASSISLTPVLVIIVVLLVVLIVVVVVIKFIFKIDPKGICIMLDHKPDHANLPKDPLPTPKVSSEPVKLYIVFVNDHEKHKAAVLSFVDFLTGDLSFDVAFELYQREQLYVDPVSWMDKNFKEADRVIVVWSPGAHERWQKYNGTSKVENDLFTPVVKMIRNDLFRDKNLEKYVFVYFDYCDEKHIPSDFIGEYPHMHYKLMQQFTGLYFKLRGIERFAAGYVVKEKKAESETYFDEKLTGNKLGGKLHDELIKMNEYVRKNPEWYKEKPIVSKFEVHSVSDGDIKKNCLKVVPPVDVESDSASDSDEELTSIPCSSTSVTYSADDSAKPSVENESAKPLLFEQTVSMQSPPLQQNLHEPGSVTILSMGSSEIFSCTVPSTTIDMPETNLSNPKENTNFKEVSPTPILSLSQYPETFAKKTALNEDKFSAVVEQDFVSIDSGFASNPADFFIPSSTRSDNDQYGKFSLLENPKDLNLQPPVALVPLEISGNPMESLVSINKLTCKM